MHFKWCCVFVLLWSFGLCAQTSDVFTDEQIRQLLIEESRRMYPGVCPCPYSRDRVGRRCGKRSAYSKPGGHEPLCYIEDISQDAVERYRQKFDKRASLGGVCSSRYLACSR